MMFHIKLWLVQNYCALRFDKIDEVFRVYNRAKHLALFGPEKYIAIYNRIRYPISQKSGITYVFSHNYARLKVDSYDFLPIEKVSTLHVIMLIKSVFNKDQNRYYYNIFLEKFSYQLS